MKMSDHAEFLVIYQRLSFNACMILLGDSVRPPRTHLPECEEAVFVVQDANMIRVDGAQTQHITYNDRGGSSIC